MGKENISTGNCGEYFVAAELERRGFSTAVPMSNTELFDILAFNRKTHKQWAIQVKTTSEKYNRWQLSQKNEKIIDDNVVYIFVKLNDLSLPEYFIVPSADVAAHITQQYSNWLKTPGKNGQPHKENNIRIFCDEVCLYRSKWETLN